MAEEEEASPRSGQGMCELERRCSGRVSLRRGLSACLRWRGCRRQTQTSPPACDVAVFSVPRLRITIWKGHGYETIFGASDTMGMLRLAGRYGM
ncbi:hypothetical protein U9M48_017442 [Paspalum notatum var. saurae]|uniref:Uncharacterized protein n=1 Tax=Paspalum notatum var. saurae TaxID=547442 RepID=A0AAQ3T7X4_PASNO